MDPAPKRVAAYQANQPQDKKHDSNRPKHLSLLKTRPAIASAIGCEPLQTIHVVSCVETLAGCQTKVEIAHFVRDLKVLREQID